jgi:Tol biopolymer transport system component
MFARNPIVSRRGRIAAVVALGCSPLAFVFLRLVPCASSDEPPATERVSVATSGVQAAGESLAPAISADGRRVAFVSWASNLVAGDTNAVGDLFLRDRVSGTTACISVASSGVPANGESYEPAISADGGWVAFVSDASNLVAGDTNQVGDVFVHQLSSGSTVRASVASNGGEADAASNAPVLSGDGRFVAFHSSASNLVVNDTNKQSDVFVRDLQTGTTERVSVSASGAQADGMSESASISESGRFVAFASTAPNLVSPADENRVWDVFVRDRDMGSVIRASVPSSGCEGNGHSVAPSISADGSSIAFESEATNLVAGDTNGRADVFVRDLGAGTTTRVSVNSSGAQGNGRSTHPSISADGRYVAYLSAASNLVAGDTNGAPDVFLFDRTNGSIARVSLGSLDVQGNKASTWSVLSRDGRFVAFPSASTQLVDGDSNAAMDVFVRGPLF